MLLKAFWYNILDSTMDEAKRLIRSGQVQDTAYIVAHHQTCGRGTRGRAWSSPPNAGIYISLIHLPPKNTSFEITTTYTLSAGVACIEAIQEITKIQASLKPINDIFFQGKKLGGILIESEASRNGITKLITGIGINTNKAVRILDDPNYQAISLEEILLTEDFKKFSKEQLIKSIVEKVCYWHNLVFNGKEKEIKESWEIYKLKEKDKTKIFT